MRPDAIVDQHGEDITHHKADSPTYDQWDVADPNQTYTDNTIKAIVSKPSADDEIVVEGRRQLASYRLTVPSGTDIKATREGNPDEVTVRGDRLIVDEVREDTHPMTGETKKTVLLAPRPGRP